MVLQLAKLLRHWNNLNFPPPPAVILSTALISMLVLSDGLCPSVAAAVASTAGFVFASTADRFRAAANSSDGLRSLLSVPWRTVVGWWILESLFFFSTGHQVRNGFHLI